MEPQNTLRLDLSHSKQHTMRKTLQEENKKIVKNEIVVKRNAFITAICQKHKVIADIPF